MLSGVLVDLVPYGDAFKAQDHTWRNGPGVFYWATGGRWFVTRAGIERMHADQREEREGGSLRVGFGVQTKDGTPIGLFGINHLDPHSRLAMLTALIGDPAYWGGGYGTDALLLLVDYAFDWLDVRKVWLMTMSLNDRVMRQMEKTGFTLEARMREAAWANGAWCDTLAYSMFREDWPGREALIQRIGLRARKDA